MNIYSMKNIKWSSRTLGETKITTGESGCAIISLAMIDGRTPDLILDILNRNKCFNEKGELFMDQAAKALGMNYKKTLEKPDILCMAETDHWKKKGRPKHFFVWLADATNSIIDPLDGQLKNNPYKVVSWRLFTKKLMFIFEHPKDPEVKAKKVTWIERIKEYLSDVMDWISKVGFDSVPRRGVA